MFVNDAMDAVSVALLARPGAARERLRDALAQAGTLLVLEEDPEQLPPQALLAASPQAVVIALEPAVEAALERLESVLSSPDFILVFDEAELAARREGWEMQRWARHLAAKLQGHRQVLPPGAEEEKEEGAGPAGPPPLDDHRHWALLDIDAMPDAPPPPASPPALPGFDPGTMRLVAMEPAMEPAIDPGNGAGARGAVAVLAGIGGPDALRRLLGALPPRLEIPLLVRMPLDGARYDNLVKQMARVSPLPVVLAEPRTAVTEGQVYILGDAIALALRAGRLHFQARAQGLDLSVLPAADSAVILLSGADPAQVDAALALAGGGAWVGGQVGQGCYDPAAAAAVVAAGMFAGDPHELAQAIGARWAPQEQGEQP